MNEKTSRIDAEWIALNAFRELTKIASKGDAAKSTYDNALDLGGQLYPELLGPEKSVLRRARESDTAREYRQKAQLLSIKNKETVNPLPLILGDIRELKELLAVAEHGGEERARVDQLKKKLSKLVFAERELNPSVHTEHQLIFRDAYNVERNLPSVGTGQGYKEFRLPDDNFLRVRVLHPDKPEHISGADIIYERQSPNEERASIVAIQYKIWENKTLYLSDPRMKEQLARLRGFICENGLCFQETTKNAYRFPWCAAFLRPTDKLQRADQKFISTGEHLPICRIDDCKTETNRGAVILQYEDMRESSLSTEPFEYLFNNGKIGSRMLSYPELEKLYAEYSITSAEDSVVIYAQEFLPDGPFG